MARLNPSRGPRIVQGPSRAMWLIALGLMVVAVGYFGWMMFDLGRERAGYFSARASAELGDVEDEIDRLERRNAELVSKLALIERGAQIDTVAEGALRERIKELQEDRLRLEKEVTFLRSVVSTDGSGGTIDVKNFSLFSGDGDDEFRFRFTLTRALKSTGVVSGTVRVGLSGVRDGVIERVELDDVTADRGAELSFKFRNFQELQGIVRLPAGFVPDNLELDIEPKGKDQKPSRRSYDWVVTS